MRNMANGRRVAVREIPSEQDVANLRSRILELEQECEDLRLGNEELQLELDEALMEQDELSESNAELNDTIEAMRVSLGEIETLACRAQFES